VVEAVATAAASARRARCRRPAETPRPCLFRPKTRPPVRVTLFGLRRRRRLRDEPLDPGESPRRAGKNHGRRALATTATAAAAAPRWREFHAGYWHELEATFGQRYIFPDRAAGGRAAPLASECS
jgi:hypothetical protein